MKLHIASLKLLQCLQKNALKNCRTFLLEKKVLKKVYQSMFKSTSDVCIIMIGVSYHRTNKMSIMRNVFFVSRTIEKTELFSQKTTTKLESSDL